MIKSKSFLFSSHTIPLLLSSPECSLRELYPSFRSCTYPAFALFSPFARSRPPTFASFYHDFLQRPLLFDRFLSTRLPSVLEASPFLSPSPNKMPAYRSFCLFFPFAVCSSLPSPPSTLLDPLPSTLLLSRFAPQIPLSLSLHRRSQKKLESKSFDLFATWP